MYLLKYRHANTLQFNGHIYDTGKLCYEYKTKMILDEIVQIVVNMK